MDLENCTLIDYNTWKLGFNSEYWVMLIGVSKGIKKKSLNLEITYCGFQKVAKIISKNSPRSGLVLIKYNFAYWFIFC
jgi:hypothetical protein